MPCINFMPRFVAPILAGTKVHTVRVLGAMPHRAGEMLYMQHGTRFRPVRFMTAPATRVREICLHETTLTIWNEDHSGFVVPPLDAFARADGFADWADFRRFFNWKRQIPAQLIQWAPAEWER
jgi:hypothetical protein